MQQISVNIAFSLGITRGLDILFKHASLPEGAELDLPQFTAWFLSKFELEDKRALQGELAVVGTR